MDLVGVAQVGCLILKRHCMAQTLTSSEACTSLSTQPGLLMIDECVSGLESRIQEKETPPSRCVTRAAEMHSMSENKHDSLRACLPGAQGK